MLEIIKGTPLHRLSLMAGSAGPTAEVFAGDVADACNLCATKSAFVKDLKEKSAVRPGDRLSMPTADIRKLIAAAQGQTIDGNVVSDSGDPHEATDGVEDVSEVRDLKQPTTDHKVTAVSESPSNGTLKSQMMPKK